MEQLKRFLQPQGLTVSLDSVKGRCLVATKNFSPGEVILKEEPYACVPKASCSESVCHGCFKSSNLMKCSACQVVWYCGTTCQKQEWKVHQLECKALSSLTNDGKKLITPRMRLVVKLYIRRKLQSEKVISSTASDNYNLVEMMVTHISNVTESKLAAYTKKAEIVKLMLPWAEINVPNIVENFSKLACNACAICDYEMKPLGTGLYPVTSIINHSCVPNTVLVFEGRVAVIRAVNEISNGAEVLLSYEDTIQSENPKDALEGKYFFTCSCPRCDNLDVFVKNTWGTFRCKDDHCDGIVGPGNACNQCGLARSGIEDQKLLDQMISFDAKLSSALSSGNIKEAISKAKRLEEAYLKFLHPSSFEVVGVQNQIMQIFLDSGQTKEALKYCRLTLPVYERAYLGFHPLLGLRYFTCAKIEWLRKCPPVCSSGGILVYGSEMENDGSIKCTLDQQEIVAWRDGDKETAVELLNKAADILKITHGSDSAFVKDLLETLEKAKSLGKSRKRSQQPKRKIKSCYERLA